MLAFLIGLGILWIIVKIIAMMIELPFRFLGTLMSLPFSVIFWIILIAAIIWVTR